MPAPQIPPRGGPRRPARPGRAAVRAGLCLLLLMLPPAPAAAQESGEFGLLVEEPGAEETYYACTGCHSEMIIAQQGKTREGWAGLLDWMTAEQGMPELDPDERGIILDYLAAHYNTDRPNFPRP